MKQFMRALAALAMFTLPIATFTVFAADDYRQISWEALVPKGWDPAKEFKSLGLAELKDSDPKAMEALQKMKEMWDSAPTEPSLNGARIRIPGFAIPLEKKGDKVTEFLVVPYFGACIHSPPPPANQIIHAISKKPRAGMKIMDPVWVSGTMSLQHANTSWGTAGYRLSVELVAPYEQQQKKGPQK